MHSIRSLFVVLVFAAPVAASDPIRVERVVGDAGGSVRLGHLAAGSGTGNACLALVPGGGLCVADTSNHQVLVIGEAGGTARSFGSLGCADGQLRQPYGVAAGPDGAIFVEDDYDPALNRSLKAVQDAVTYPRIQKFSSDGKVAYVIGGAGRVPGTFFGRPGGMAVDAKGQLYVADRGNNRVQVFDAKGKFIREFGSFGTGPGQLDTPTFIAVGENGTSYVLDSGNHRVAVFDELGVFKNSFGSQGRGEGQFNAAFGLALVGDQVRLVDEFSFDTDFSKGGSGSGFSRFRASIQRFSPGGTFLGRDTLTRRFALETDGLPPTAISFFPVTLDGQGRLWIFDARRLELWALAPGHAAVNAAAFERSFGAEIGTRNQLYGTRTQSSSAYAPTPAVYGWQQVRREPYATAWVDVRHQPTERLSIQSRYTVSQGEPLETDYNWGGPVGGSTLLNSDYRNGVRQWSHSLALGASYLFDLDWSRAVDVTIVAGQGNTRSARTSHGWSGWPVGTFGVTSEQFESQPFESWDLRLGVSPTRGSRLSLGYTGAEYPQTDVSFNNGSIFGGPYQQTSTSHRLPRTAYARFESSF